MIGSTVSTFANTQYKCCECNKILWDKYSRLKGKKVLLLLLTEYLITIDAQTNI